MSEQSKPLTPVEQAHLDKVGACLNALNEALAAARADGFIVRIGGFGTPEPKPKFVGKIFDMERGKELIIAHPDELIHLYRSGMIDSEDELTPEGRKWLETQHEQRHAIADLGLEPIP